MSSADPARRRRLLAGAIAVGALGAGGGAALWRTRKPVVDDDDDAAPLDLWQLSFARLDDSTLRMAGLRGKPLLINFWATWCAPCVHEMPLLDRFAASPAAAGWHVLALAVDGAAPVRRFIEKNKLRLPVAIAGAQGIALSRQLGNRVGALPYTIVFAANGEVAERKLGPVDAPLLHAWASRVSLVPKP